eukprot:TRINITY_DN3994_c0_g1_i2.p1 TRINITY_DN3994_c0_g1~~TRINITY_DN3994_c0_g1_i2.p1  ORF type:complete len:220 (-),score=13.12 TRINITY_DN3994_c0_g1_i2:502-1161(-)
MALLDAMPWCAARQDDGATGITRIFVRARAPLQMKDHIFHSSADMQISCWVHTQKASSNMEEITYLNTHPYTPPKRLAIKSPVNMLIDPGHLCPIALKCVLQDTARMVVLQSRCICAYEPHKDVRHTCSLCLTQAVNSTVFEAGSTVMFALSNPANCLTAALVYCSSHMLTKVTMKLPLDEHQRSIASCFASTVGAVYVHTRVRNSPVAAGKEIASASA